MPKVTTLYCLSKNQLEINLYTSLISWCKNGLLKAKEEGVAFFIFELLNLFPDEFKASQRIVKLYIIILP